MVEKQKTKIKPKSKIEELDLDQEIIKLAEKDYSTLQESHGFMTNGAVGGFKSAIDKMQYPFSKQLLLGMLAGLIVGLAYGAAIAASFQIPDSQSWIKTVILGVAFPGAILMITFLGGGLFTSHVVATIPMFKGVVGRARYMKSLTGVYIGNFLGTGAVVIILALSGVFNKTGVSFGNEMINNLGAHKLLLINDAIEAGRPVTFSDAALTFIYVFFSGILCNFLVSSTLPITSSTKSNGTAALVMLFPVAYFVMAGLQHSPANTTFFWAFLVDIILGSKHNPHSAELFGWFIGFNLLPALLGNWVGGAIVMSGLLNLTQNKYTQVLFDHQRLIRLEKIKLKLTDLGKDYKTIDKKEYKKIIANI